MRGDIAAPRFVGPASPAMGRRLVESVAPLYGLGPEARARTRVERVARRGRHGALIILSQQVDDVPVWRSRLAVLVDSDGNFRAAGGTLHPGAGMDAPLFALSALDAGMIAIRDVYPGLNPPAGARLLRAADARPGDSGDIVRLAPTPTARRLGVELEREVGARRVLFPLPGELVPAYYMELWLPEQTGDDATLIGLAVSALDGSVLYRSELVDREAFTYRVWADTSPPFAPLDGPEEDFTPHPTGMNDGLEPGVVSPELITMEAFNSNPVGGVDPWLPDGATESAGNNADAYADLGYGDGYHALGDFRAETTSPGVFDWTYDLSLEPDENESQHRAAATHLFYVVNWLHDYFYDSGFDEAAGNAQNDNFGRGGVEGDAMRAEAHDWGGVNNANMATPVDGEAPRMQMYIWEGRHRAEVLLGPERWPASVARFGPESFHILREVVVVDDGVGITSDGCSPILNSLEGKIALIDRGDCTFIEKTERAEAAGAVAVLVMNNNPAQALQVMNGPADNDVEIPALLITTAQGDLLRTTLPPPQVSMIREVESVARSSALDTTIVAHEWGHYLFRRLAPPCTTAQCDASSEGWSDFLGLYLAARPGDDLDGVYPFASYSSYRTPGYEYFGLRRVPYSTDSSVNALTFRHISDDVPLPTHHPVRENSSPNYQIHNAGTVWAGMLWEAFVSLLRRSQAPESAYSFDEAKRRMADYIVAGMQLFPANATWMEQRAALLEVIAVADADDHRAISAAFARRGAGACAVGPERESVEFMGVEEDFEVRGLAEVASLTLDEADFTVSCDGDGLLDVGEQSALRVSVVNHGADVLTGSTLNIDTQAAGIRFPDGSSVAIPDIQPGQSTELQIPIALVARIAPASVTMRAEVVPSAPCPLSVESFFELDMNADITPTTRETFDHAEWFRTETVGGYAQTLWSVGPSGLGADGNVAHAWGSRYYSDTAMLLPPIEVSAAPGETFSLSFEHRFRFEASTQGYWDGGLLDFSIDGGATWQDVSDLADPGYIGEIRTGAANPLAERMAWVDRNPSWPDVDRVTLEFGTALSGQTVHFRFRQGLDYGLYYTVGWEIDEIVVEGAATPPFSTLSSNAVGCAPPPLPDGGPLWPVDWDAGADAGALASDPGPSAGGCDCNASGARGADPSPGVWFLMLLPLLAWSRRRRLSPLYFFAAALVCLGCADDEVRPSRAGGVGHSCQLTNDCEEPLQCIDGTCRSPNFGIAPTDKYCVGPPECVVDDDCPDPDERCEDEQCVWRCSSDLNCGDTTYLPQYCEVPTGECRTVCASDSDCFDPILRVFLGRCDVGAGYCVDCLNADDCRASSRCVDSQCVAGCATDADCPAFHACSASGACEHVGCLSDRECISASSSPHAVCDASIGSCRLSCANDAECSFLSGDGEYALLACVDGFCEEIGCETDAECRALHGSGYACESSTSSPGAP